MPRMIPWCRIPGASSRACQGLTSPTPYSVPVPDPAKRCLVSIIRLSPSGASTIGVPTIKEKASVPRLCYNTQGYTKEK